MKIVKSSVVADVLAQLGNSIQMLNTELHQQISSRHEDLLAQTTGIESLESVLDVMTSRIGSLKVWNIVIGLTLKLTWSRMLQIFCSWKYNLHLVNLWDRIFWILCVLFSLSDKSEQIEYKFSLSKYITLDLYPILTLKISVTNKFHLEFLCSHKYINNIFCYM